MFFQHMLSQVRRLAKSSCKLDIQPLVSSYREAPLMSRSYSRNGRSSTEMEMNPLGGCESVSGHYCWISCTLSLSDTEPHPPTAPTETATTTDAKATHVTGNTLLILKVLLLILNTAIANGETILLLLMTNDRTFITECH